MQVTAISESLGAELIDFPVDALLSPKESRELRILLCEHHLLVARNGSPSESDQDRFVQNFGPIQPLPQAKQVITNRRDRSPDENDGAGRLLWHSDGAYGPRPGIGTCLWAQEVSDDSSPTMFCSATRALVNLPDDLRQYVGSLHAMHIVDISDVWNEGDDIVANRVREADIPADADPNRYRRFVHPVKFKLPHSGMHALFVTEQTTSHVTELSLNESEALIQELFSYLYAETNVYTHHWRSGDLLIWDNLALQHCRPLASRGGTRQMRRLSLDGWITDEGVLDWKTPALLEQDRV